MLFGLVPGLRPATIHYITKVASKDGNIGMVGQRKDFLDTMPEDGKAINEVIVDYYIQSVLHLTFYTYTCM